MQAYYVCTSSTYVLLICLLCSFGIRSHGPFTRLFLWCFLVYSGEEHFTFTLVQSPAGRLVVKIIETVFFFDFRLNLHSLFQKTPAESRQLNKDCILLDFYDNHDIWHFLSASAMFCTFMVRYNSTIHAYVMFHVMYAAFSISWPMYTTE